MQIHFFYFLFPYLHFIKVLFWTGLQKLLEMKLRNIIKASIICLVISISSLNLFANKNIITHMVDISMNNGQKDLSQLLSLYYDVKNALVNADAATASAKAGELLNAINNMDVKSLSPNDKKAFTAVQNKLEYDARHISEVKELAHQREHFASLSKNMYALAKNAKLSGQPVYEQYCPMKDAYWLSNETAIKNPYYGSSMLACGEVKDTLK